MVIERLSDETVTRAAGFDYGASGRGGWDEAPAVVVPARKRSKKDGVRRDADFYLARAAVQGRSVVEVMQMPTDKRGSGNRGGVYMLANIVTRDFYIGCSRGMRERWRSHVWGMRLRRHHVPRINSLVRRHGLGSFRFLILQAGLCEIHSARRLSAEKRWIDALRPTLNRPNVGTRGKPNHGVRRFWARCARVGAVLINGTWTNPKTGRSVSVELMGKPRTVRAF